MKPLLLFSHSMLPQKPRCPAAVCIRLWGRFRGTGNVPCQMAGIPLDCIPKNRVAHSCDGEPRLSTLKEIRSCRQGKHAIERNLKMQLGFLAFSVNSFTFILFLLCFCPAFHIYSHSRHPEVQDGSSASDLSSFFRD